MCQMHPSGHQANAVSRAFYSFYCWGPSKPPMEMSLNEQAAWAAHLQTPVIFNHHAPLTVNETSINYVDLNPIKSTRKAVANEEKGKMDIAEKELSIIAGQKPVRCKAKKSVANFKIREGEETGLKVTLRGVRMYEFLDRLVTVALPRVRDFRGLDPKSFDGRGNYALGVKEHIIFPEIDYDKAEAQLGLDIVVCTTAKTDAEAQALLRAFNFPFRQ